MVDQSDGELLSAIVRRDPAALVALYDRYARLSFALAYRILDQAPLAEEVVQDAFMSVWQRADSFDQARGGNVRAWLLTIVHNRALDVRRRMFGKRLPPVDLDEVDYLVSSPDPSAEVLRNLDRDRVRAAVAELPLEQRQAIELAYFDGLTHIEIAERTAAPLGTVKSRLRLGLQKLYAMLAFSEQIPGAGADR